ncbi:MAG: hypothetical protein IJB86_07940 [Clostridia bacterium]|nr:hypothetical protein [Clostridia bacterium]
MLLNILIEILLIALPLAIIAFLVYAPIRFFKLKNKEKKDPSSVSAEEMKDGKILLCMALTVLGFLLMLFIIILIQIFLLDSYWFLTYVVLCLGPAISLIFFIHSLVKYKKIKKKTDIDPDTVSKEELKRRKLNLTLSLTIIGVLVVCAVILFSLYTMFMLSM